jgi:hypothetical protein
MRSRKIQRWLWLHWPDGTNTRNPVNQWRTLTRRRP